MRKESAGNTRASGNNGKQPGKDVVRTLPAPRGLDSPREFAGRRGTAGPQSFASIPKLASQEIAPGEHNSSLRVHSHPALPLQRKLAIGTTNDPLEAEADATADRVMQGASASATHSSYPAVQRKCACKGSGQPCAECEEEKSKVQRKATAATAPTGAPPIVDQVLGSAGQPLDGATRAFMEPRLGRDFSGVRIHTGSQAAQSAHEVNAVAYTVGRNIVFGGGEYAPETSSGKRLLAHELTHVVQQTDNAGSPMSGDGTSDKLQRQTPEKKTSSSTTATACPKGMPVGAAHAYPEDHSLWSSGSYAIWGPPFDKQDANTYSEQTIQAWIRWRFGTLSSAVANRIQAEATAEKWKWSGPIPNAGCQGTTSFPIALMSRWVGLAHGDPEARGAESREAKAGMPALPPPEPIADVVVVAPRAGSSAAQTPQPDLRTRVEEALDPTSVYEKGAPGATDPPFPARMDGPEMEVPRGIGTYTMALDRAAVTSDPIMQMAYYMNTVRYHWELFNITEMVRAGMGRNAQEDARRTSENARAADASGGATRRRGQAAFEELSEETIRSWKELRDPRKAAEGGSAVDVVTRSYANELNLVLLPASAIKAAGGFLVQEIADLFGDFSQEKEISFPQREGYYMVRCIAQPSPRGPNNSERRAASVQTKIVEVRPIEGLARNALDAPEAAVAELQLQRAMTSDPAAIARIDQQIAAVQLQSSGDIVAYLTQAIADREAAKAQAPSWQRSQYDGELESLKLRLEQAKQQRVGTGATHYRPRAAFTSLLTGDTYPLVLELNDLEAKSGFRVRLTDLTLPDRAPTERNGATREQAVRNAFHELAFHDDLGRGRLVVRMPENWPGGPSELSLETGDANTAVVRKRLQDLATALLVLSVVVPGVGEVSAVITAALAVERLLERAANGNLRLDAESVSDTIAVLGAMAQGAQLVGKLRVVRAGRSFLAAERAGEQGALETALRALETARAAGKVLDATAAVTNAGGLIWGDLVMLDQLARIQQDEMDGRVTHSEARRKRAEMLAGAIRDHGIMLAGALRPQTANRASGVETTVRPSAPEAPPGAAKGSRSAETIEEPELERRAAEGAPAGTGKQKAQPAEDAVRVRFRTPDGLHDIFVLNDGRIFRCSLTCAQLRAWYEPYLTRQPEGTRRQAATELENSLKGLEDRARNGENTPALNEAIGRLDVNMREFIAPDLAGQLQRGAESQRMTRPGESFLSIEQTRNLIRVLNVDEVLALVEKGGARSAAEVRQMADLWGEVLSHTPSADVVRLRSMNERLHPNAEQLGAIRQYLAARHGLESRAVADLASAATVEQLEGIAYRDNVIPPGADANAVTRIEAILMNKRISLGQGLHALLREYLELRRDNLDAALTAVENVANEKRLFSALRQAAEARTASSAAAPKPRDPIYRHAIDGHGSQLSPDALMSEAATRRGTGVPQGQFYNNAIIPEADALAPQGPGEHVVDFGRPIGRVFLPDRTVLSDVTRVLVVRMNGSVDAYPIPPWR